MSVIISGTNGIQNVLGSASSPADTNTTTPTTGVYYPSATTWGVSTAGTNALYIDASQNVGIGTTSPYSKLYVVTNNNTYDGISIQNPSTGTSAVSWLQFGNNVVSYAGGIGINGGNSTQPGGANALYISQGQAAPMVFATNSTERMRIDSSGNVGIGTSTPKNTLDVNGDISCSAGNAFDSNLYYSGGWKFIGNGYGGFIKLADGSGAITFNLTSSSNGSGSGASATPNERMRIDSSGNLLVGTTSATGHFTLKQSSNNYGGGFALVRQDTTDNWQFRVDGSSTLLFGYNSSDRGSFNSGTGAYTALSDRNKKKDFEDSTIGLSAVMQLKPTLYRMIDEEETSDKHLGFIAQEVKEVIPPAYVELGDENNKFIGLDYQPIVSALVKAIQELKAEFDAYKAAHP